MFKRLVPVSKDRHMGKRVKGLDDCHFARKTHIASLTAHEFARAAGSMPIVFLEDKDNARFLAVGMLGFEDGENLMVHPTTAQWEPGYIPAIIRRYPFALARSDREDVFNILIDEDSGLVSDTEGEPLFTEDGEPAERMQNVQRYLGELHQMNEFTTAFCAFLAQHELFKPLEIRIPQGNGARDITGCLRVDEEKVNQMSDEMFLELRTKRYLAPIYAHLISLQQVERLIRLRQARA